MLDKLVLKDIESQGNFFRWGTKHNTSTTPLFCCHSLKLNLLVHYFVQILWNVWIKHCDIGYISVLSSILAIFQFCPHSFNLNIFREKFVWMEVLFGPFSLKNSFDYFCLCLSQWCQLDDFFYWTFSLNAAA